jgi:2-hydroxy-6-oxonona-2,4-dienedioate hydrolase
LATCELAEQVQGGDATDLVPLESVWVELDGLRTHGRVASLESVRGQLPIVLVHGLNVSSSYLVPTGERLARHRPVYAPDLPGFGHSQRPARALDIPQLADALVAWLDRLGVARATMLGNSMGCQIIAELALRYPARVAAAILVGPTMDRVGRNGLTQALRLLRDVGGESWSSIATQFADYLRFGPWRSLRTLRYALDDRIEQKLPHLQLPTLVVRGEHDPVAPQRWAEEVCHLLPQGQLAVIPGAPHALNYDTPEALARLTERFLAQLAHPSRPFDSSSGPC